MDYVRLGTTGLKVSRICLGCMTYGSPKWRDWVLGRRGRAAVHRAGLGARASTSSTPPTCTRSVRAKRCWAGR